MTAAGIEGKRAKQMAAGCRTAREAGTIRDRSRRELTQELKELKQATASEPMGA